MRFFCCQVYVSFESSANVKPRKDISNIYIYLYVSDQSVFIGFKGAGRGSSEPPLDPPLTGDFLENAISTTGDFFQNVSIFITHVRNCVMGATPIRLHVYVYLPMTSAAVRFNVFV